MTDSPSPQPAPTAASEPTVPASLSPGRRRLFRLVAVLLLWLLSEALAWAVLWRATGSPVPQSALREERTRLIAADSATAGAAGAAPTGGGFASQTEVVHPYLGYTYDPDSSGLVDSRGVRHPVNEWGLVGTGSPVRKRSPGKVIVAVTGGSVALLFAEEGAGRLAERLSASPRFAGKEFEFVPLALGGWKQPQQLQALAFLLSLGAEFDLVLNIDGFNEVALPGPENAAAGVFPAYPRNWRLKAADLPDPDARRAIGEMLSLRRRRAEWAARSAFAWRPMRWSALVNLVWLAGDRPLAAEAAAAEETVRSAAGRASSATNRRVAGPPFPAADREAVSAEAVAVWRRSSQQMHALCRGNAVRYFHFLQPNQYVAGSKPMSEPERRVALRDDHPYRAGAEAAYPRLIAEGTALRAAGVPFTDLTGVFRAHPEPLYFDDCCHVNADGNAILADAIAEAILAEEGVGSRQ
jgi:hypothetical protein